MRNGKTSFTNQNIMILKYDFEGNLLWNIHIVMIRALIRAKCYSKRYSIYIGCLWGKYKF
ncbi:hypothetical protein J2127_001724 [Methanococcus voltae]|uniref:hypothetical protein n=1 Tax=Methanococcus voltae TaxID=2188 RepID=UPI001AE4B606|nr:hypothetical protein [Methanococcus voltae]MBP2144541.1 hypothetical protein [Methanococcus voltae]